MEPNDWRSSSAEVIWGQKVAWSQKVIRGQTYIEVIWVHFKALTEPWLKILWPPKNFVVRKTPLVPVLMTTKGVFRPRKARPVTGLASERPLDWTWKERQKLEKDLRTCHGKKTLPNPASFPALDHLNEEYCFPVTGITLSETVKDWFQPEGLQIPPVVNRK